MTFRKIRSCLCGIYGNVSGHGARHDENQAERIGRSHPTTSGRAIEFEAAQAENTVEAYERSSAVIPAMRSSGCSKGDVASAGQVKRCRPAGNGQPVTQ